MGAAPSTGEGAQIDIELGLTEAGAIREASRRVGNRLELSLGVHILLNDGLESQVSITENIHKGFESKRSVAGPGVVICASLVSGQPYN